MLGKYRSRRTPVLGRRRVRIPVLVAILILACWTLSRPTAPSPSLAPGEVTEDFHKGRQAERAQDDEKRSSSAEGYARKTKPDTPFEQVEDHTTERGAPAHITEESLREQYLKEYEDLGRKPGAGAIYGNTLSDLRDSRFRSSSSDRSDALKPVPGDEPPLLFTQKRPYIFSPYPRYNTPEWRAEHPHDASYVPCEGPGGMPVDDTLVFRGYLPKMPRPGFGSYELIGIDEELCYERDTRLGRYGLQEGSRRVNWDKVNWGLLQDTCVSQNAARFDLKGSPNPYMGKVYKKSWMKWQERPPSRKNDDEEEDEESKIASDGRGDLKRDKAGMRPATDEKREEKSYREPRTAILLRNFVGRSWTSNDQQVIRSLIMDLTLRTGGAYQVFLLTQAPGDSSIETPAERQRELTNSNIPREFHSITILWTEMQMRALYPRLSDLDKPEDIAQGLKDEIQMKFRLHNAQFMPVQAFMQQQGHRSFDHVWNWEMDVRLIGQQHDLLEKVANFSRAQPRRGLWERNERFYIPEVHGEYDTDFRAAVERNNTGLGTVWGAPLYPFVDPVGPTPRFGSPEDDEHYSWGVGEESDLITLSPIFNPVNSNWILRDQIWGYESNGFPALNTSRRTSVVTQQRMSRRLLDIMHVENTLTRHIGSEMVAPTVALLHGLKAVYAPVPVHFDRPWTGKQLAHWFNMGPRGESGEEWSAFGYYREGRFQGATWYFRADPPQKLYNNWLGFEDSGKGGAEWEEANGRPCLPAMFLHPVKAVVPTEPGYASESKLPYR